MLGLGPQELLLVLLIILLLFGASRVPQLARSLGTASKEFKKGIEGDEGETKKKRKTAKAKS
jgi:sec-independent protein translocase protein TatA